jgi:uncharacterized protein
MTLPPMQSKLVAENTGQRTFVMILDAGEEAFSTIADFAVKEGFSAASLTALGASSAATVGWFGLAKKTPAPAEPCPQSGEKY